jgi:nucleotide-binding universal stress UspA family protein
MQTDPEKEQAMSSPIIVGLALREDDTAPLALGGLLADRSDAPLTLACACPREVPAPLPPPHYANAFLDQTGDALEAVAKTLPGGEATTTHAAFGSRAGVLQALAEELDATAIVVGSTHRGDAGRVMMGDVAAGLLHGSTCPVVVAPRGYAGADLHRIGVAFDGSPESHAALSAAAGLAARTGGTIHCYTVLEPTEVTPVYTTPGWVASPAYEERRLELAQEAAGQALETNPAGTVATSEVLHGPIVATLAQASEALDVLVCGSRGYGALRSVLAGGVSRGLAHRAACALVVVPRRASVRLASPWQPPDAVQTG